MGYQQRERESRRARRLYARLSKRDVERQRKFKKSRRRSRKRAKIDISLQLARRKKGRVLRPIMRKIEISTTVTPKEKDAPLPTQKVERRITRFQRSKFLKKVAGIGAGGAFFAGAARGVAGTAKLPFTALSKTTALIGSAKARKITATKAKLGYNVAKKFYYKTPKQKRRVAEIAARKAKISYNVFRSKPAAYQRIKIAETLGNITGSAGVFGAASKLAKVKRVRKTPIVKGKVKVREAVRTKEPRTITYKTPAFTLKKTKQVKVSKGVFGSEFLVYKPKIFGKGYRKSPLVVEEAGIFKTTFPRKSLSRVKTRGIRKTRRRILKPKYKKTRTTAYNIKVKQIPISNLATKTAKKGTSVTLTKKGIEAISVPAYKAKVMGKKTEAYFSAIRQKGKIKGFASLFIEPSKRISKGSKLTSFSAKQKLKTKVTNKQSLQTAMGVQASTFKKLAKEHTITGYKFGKGKNVPVYVKLTPKKTTPPSTLTIRPQARQTTKARTRTVIKAKTKAALIARTTARQKARLKTATKAKAKTKAKPQAKILTTQAIKTKVTTKSAQAVGVALKIAQKQKLKKALAQRIAQQTTTRAGVPYFNFGRYGKISFRSTPKKTKKKLKAYLVKRNGRYYVEYSPSLAELDAGIIGKPQLIGFLPRPILRKRKAKRKRRVKRTRKRSRRGRR